MIPILAAMAVVALDGPAPQAALVCSDVRVLDGDTIVACSNRIRLFGINAPEIAHPGLHIAQEPGGPEAKARMIALVSGKQVTCVPAGNQHDRYGRTVAKCGVDGVPDLGAEMVKEHLACVWKRYAGHTYDSLGRFCGPKGKQP